MVSVRVTCAILTYALLLTSCATAPKDAASRQPAVALPGGATAASGADAAGATAATTSAPAAQATASTTASAEPVSPAPIVDVNRQPPAENTGQLCRVMLKPNTNSLINVCGTPAEWKRYNAAEAEATKELVIRMRSAPTLPTLPPPGAGMR